MKIKRFTGKTMRDAIRQVREEQGPDALILSNRRTPEGIEVVAAVDYDAALMQQSLRTPEPNTSAPLNKSPSLPTLLRTPPKSGPAAAPSSELDGQRHWPLIRTPKQARTAAIEIASQQAARTPPPAAPAAPVASADMTELKQEISGVKSMLRDQLSGLLWDQLKLRQPRRVAVLRALSSLSVSPQLARQIASEVPEDTSDDRARFLPLGLLARRIPIATDDLVMQGGIIAFVGPTGVGKTTTLAKLAARFGARHGLRDVALVTTDTWRIGAQEQLHTYGRLLGVPVHTAANAEQLQQTLAQLSDRKLVLIDTAGMSPRDRNLAGQFSAISQSNSSSKHNIRSLLVMAANSQAADLDEAARRFTVANPCGCVLTKLDEASRIGGALSVAISRKLPIAYLCDGQRVPEDLHVAHANRLVIRAQQLARSAPASLDDDTMALQFGGNPNA